MFVQHIALMYPSCFFLARPKTENAHCSCSVNSMHWSRWSQYQEAPCEQGSVVHNAAPNGHLGLYFATWKNLHVYWGAGKYTHPVFPNVFQIELARTLQVGATKRAQIVYTHAQRGGVTCRQNRRGECSVCPFSIRSPASERAGRPEFKRPRCNFRNQRSYRRRRRSGSSDRQWPHERPGQAYGRGVARLTDFSLI